MAWHHIAGTIGGLFVLTWIFSGWMSMGPPVPWEGGFDPRVRVAAIEALAGTSEPEFPMDLAKLQQLNIDARQATFIWALGKPHIVLTDGANEQRVLDATTGASSELTEQAFIEHAPRLLPHARLTAAERIEREDAYWYARRGERTLPVLRFKFDDADRTWIHVDPATGRLVGWLRKADRIDRWLFNGLHSLDFRWLFAHRPAWDIVMWILSLAGLLISTTSIVIGWRALKR
jgi:hypothetical protein